MKNLSSLISSGAGILILVAFFLPWITVSCSSISVSGSGYELATGTVGDEELDDTDDDIETYAYLWLVPLAALVAGAAVYLRENASGHDILNTVKSIYIGASGVGLVSMLIFYAEFRSDLDSAAEEAGFDASIYEVSYEIGWWLTILAFLAIGAAGLYFLGQEEEEASAHAGADQHDRASPP